MSERIAGLIGSPVAHSISPVFQQAAFEALGFPARYERWPTSRPELPERVRMLRDGRYLGANVTVPHKEAIVLHLDEVDHVAQQVGAVNTIYKRNGRLLGTNTDVAGFRRALKEAGGFDPAGRRAVVLGAGGAARAVVLALGLEGARSVTIANRTPERAARLVADVRSDRGPALVVLPWQEATGPRVLQAADLLVHCTTLGLAGTAQANGAPVESTALHPGLFVCDIVANPLVTPLLARAEAAGAPHLGGLSMLVYQGAASFELWTEQVAPVRVMMDASEAAMRGAGRGERV